MKDKIPISESEFAFEFEDVITENIFLLPRKEAENIWQICISQKGFSFFHLPNDNWLVTSNSISIGYWLDDFNNNIKENVKLFLSESIPWDNNDTVWFCMNKYNIIQSRWIDFKEQWINFLYSESDSPILINSNYEKCAIQFLAIGNFKKIGNCNKLS